MLLAPRTAVSGVTDLVEGVSVLIGAATRFKKFFDAEPGRENQVRHHSDLFLEADWHHTCPVELEDDAQSWIGDIPLMGIISFRDISPIMVHIQATGPQDLDGVLLVKVGERRVGVLAESGSDPFWNVLQVKIGDGYPVGSAGALRSQDTDGRWRLDLGAPKNVRRWPRLDDLPDGESGEADDGDSG